MGRFIEDRFEAEFVIAKPLQAVWQSFEKQNETDFLYKAVKEKKARESILVDFKPIKDSKIGELAANFDIVIGYTPEA